MRTMPKLTLVSALSLIIAGALWVDAEAGWRWGIGISGGYETGGRLYRASADDFDSWFWTTPDGSTDIAGTEVLVETQSWASIGARVTILQDGGKWGGVLGFSLSDLDVDAVRRTVSRNVDNVPYDQIFVSNTYAAATYSVAAGNSTPYLMLGGAWVNATSEGAALDQSGPAVVLGGGWRWLWKGSSLIDIEVRATVLPLDLDDEERRLSDAIEVQNQSTGTPSLFAFDGEDHATFLELSASWSLLF